MSASDDALVYDGECAHHNGTCWAHCPGRTRRTAMSGRRVLRYEVPVDDRRHEIGLGHDARVLAVAARQPDVVEFWAEHHAGQITTFRQFRVYGTGHEIEAGRHVGTALAAGGALVWHLFDVTGS